MDLHQPPVSQRTGNLQQGRTTLRAALVSLIGKFQKLTPDYFCKIRKQSNFVSFIAISQKRADIWGVLFLQGFPGEHSFKWPPSGAAISTASFQVLTLERHLRGES